MSSTGGNDRGFTLLELLIVMALLSMMTALAIGWNSGFADRVVVSRAVDEVEKALLHAAIAAKITGQDQVIAIGRADAHAKNSNHHDGHIDVDPAVTLKWTSAVDIGTGANQASVMFFGTGGASGGTIEISKGTAEARIQVDWLTGTVRTGMAAP